MYKKVLVAAFSAVACLGLVAMLTSASSEDAIARIGVVNFQTCIDQSKLGKDEQMRFDAMKKQMEAQLEEKEKELNALAPKFTEEYLDTLTPEAEGELKNKFKTLSQDLSMQQQQAYEMLKQTNFQIMQKMNDSITSASKKVAQDKNLEFVINEETCFFYADKYDISKDVVDVMNAGYTPEQQKK